MKVKVISKRPIHRSGEPSMFPGQVYDVASLSGIEHHVQVVAETYHTKVIHEEPVRPLMVGGEPLSASPAAQASPEQTVTRRRRGRRSQPKEE